MELNSPHYLVYSELPSTRQKVRPEGEELGSPPTTRYSEIQTLKLVIELKEIQP